VWGVCRRLLSHHDAEDAFQVTFLLLVRKAASIRPRQMVANWLYGVAHLTALQSRRAMARRRTRERQVTQMPEPALAEQDLWQDLRPLLDQELARLPDKYRVALILCDLECKTRKEVSRQLGCPEGTVAARLARARVMLAKRLARHGLAVSGGGLAAALSQKVASAAVPTPVLSSTIKAATLLAGGPAAATGTIAVKVTALMDGVLKSMLLTKLKVGVAALLVVAALGGTTGLICQAWPAEQPQVPRAEQKKDDEANQPPAKAFLLPGRGNDKPSDAQAVVDKVVDKAIKAMGGADKIAKLRATTFRCKGSITAPVTGKGDFAGNWTIVLPDKCHAEMEHTVSRNVVRSMLVFNGDKAWIKDITQNTVVPVPIEAFKGVKMELGVLLLVTQLTAIKSKDVELAPLGEVKINKRAAVGVKVKRKDLTDVDLFFDKETNLPVKAEMRVKDPRDGKEAVHTFLFDNYKEVDGVKHFTKLTFLQDESECMSLELSDLKRLEKLDSKGLFEMPE